MAEVIKIFDPNEKPFGWLSNNYRHFMRIDKKEWPTVTNYIYGNILQTPMYKQNVRMAKPKDVKKEFTSLYQKESDNIISATTEKALKVKFENKALAELLAETGNAPILYVSPNKLLGVGPKNDGQNLYGQYLMQIRHMLRVAFKRKGQEVAKLEREQLIYDTYLAEKGLVDEIRGGNNLKEFINKSSAEIVDRIGRDKLSKMVPKRQIVLDMAHKGHIPHIISAVDFPETLVLEVRKKELRRLRASKLNERKELVFDMYADYMIEKHFPDLEPNNYAKAKEQQFANMGWQQRNDLQIRLYELFEQGMLSSRLSDAIDERLALMIIPSEDEVVEAENVTINYKIVPDAIDIPYVPAAGDSVMVYPTDFPQLDPNTKRYVQFSPISLTGMLRIDGLIYPTVMHYTMVNLISRIPSVTSFDAAYDLILVTPRIVKGRSPVPVKGIESFVDPQTADLRYAKLRDVDYSEQLTKNAKTGLDNKFKNRVLQDILIMTGKARLVWADYSDPVLGTGGKGQKGNNVVGKYLMELRAKFMEERKGETLDKLSEIHITMILDEDPFMKEWLNMRVRDMCKVLRIMKNYLWSKDEIDSKMNPEFTASVLDKIYQPCSDVFGASSLITADVPKYFREMVMKCPGFKEVTHETIEIMWKRIAVIIYYLIKHIQESNIQNLRTVLGRIELMVSRGANCQEIMPNEYDNCIVSAIINILKGIVEFNIQFSYSIILTDLDVKTAASIILNADVSDEVKPVISDSIQSSKWSGIGSSFDSLQTAPEDIDAYVFPDSPGEGDIDYPDNPDIEGDGEGEDSEEFIFSPKQNMILSVLNDIDEIRDAKEMAMSIEGAVDTIKTYPMSKQIKKNRINFFATQR